jgi:methionine synthase II (cobalamin-independent)
MDFALRLSVAAAGPWEYNKRFQVGPERPPVFHQRDRMLQYGMEVRPSCSASVVGSFPHVAPQSICRAILDSLPRIPAWPQLPNRSPFENMYTQYSEALPAVVFDERKQRIFFDTSTDYYPALEKFYTHFLEEDFDYFKVSPEYALGLHAFVETAAETKLGDRTLFVKGQITGPVSFGLTVTDENKRAILYHEELFDAVIKSCIMKARWQIRMLRQLHDRVILMIDEPYMSAFGSGYVSLSRDQVIRSIGALVEAIRGEEAVPGVHCCGNTDWSILMETGVQILNFDADNYLQGLLVLPPESLKAFLGNGGVLAWGIVPTTEKIELATAADVLKAMEENLDLLCGKGLERKALVERSILTPSCGLGTLSETHAEKAMTLSAEAAEALKEKVLGNDG